MLGLHVSHNILGYLAYLEKSKMATKHCVKDSFQTILGKFRYASFPSLVSWFMDVKYSPSSTPYPTC
jgi:hypothetical protein